MAELDLELRLLELHTAVTALLREHRPDVVAIERVFTQNNKGTAMGTAQAAGVAALAAAQADRPVAWHTPSEVKAAISGNGRADKEQVTLMVTRVLGLADGAQAGRRGRRPRAGRLPCLARPRAAAAAGRGSGRRHRRPDPADAPSRAGPGWQPDDRLGERPGGGGVARTARSSRSAGSASRCSARPGTIARLQVGENARLSTSLIVREDSLTLYGFADDDERSLFELLQTANGVGPRLAQAVLAIHPPREVRRAVSMADVKALMQVPGHRQEGRRAADPGAAGPARRHHLRHLARRPGGGRRRGHPGRALARPADLGPGRARLERQGGRRRGRAAGPRR